MSTTKLAGPGETSPLAAINAMLRSLEKGGAEAEVLTRRLLDDVRRAPAPPRPRARQWLLRRHG